MTACDQIGTTSWVFMSNMQLDELLQPSAYNHGHPKTLFYY